MPDDERRITIRTSLPPEELAEVLPIAAEALRRRAASAAFEKLSVDEQEAMLSAQKGEK